MTPPRSKHELRRTVESLEEGRPTVTLTDLLLDEDGESRDT